MSMRRIMESYYEGMEEYGNKGMRELGNIV